MDNNVLRVYEDQLSAYLKETKPISLPLLSWDVHMENMSTLSKLFSDIVEIGKITNKLLFDVDLIDELKNKEKVIVITDVNLKIEFASSNMLKMSGYLPSEILGYTPKIFQGKETDEKTIDQIGKHINAQEFFETIILNYKKDQSTYNCHIKAYPIFDKKGKCVKFVAVENAA